MGDTGQINKTIVIGLGNPVLSDDGVGIQVAQVIRESLVGSNFLIDVVDAYVGGLNLMELMIGYSRAVIIDAMYTGKLTPGTICCLSLAEAFQTKNSLSMHDLDLPGALELGKELGISLPREIIIWGIEAKNIYSFSEDLSLEVGQSVPIVAEMVMEKIKSN